MVHADSQQVFHCFLGEAVAPKGIRMVDFVVAVVLYGYSGISGNGKKRCLGSIHIQRRHHESIAASHIVSSAVNSHDHHIFHIIRPDDFVSTIAPQATTLQENSYSYQYKKQGNSPQPFDSCIITLNSALLSH